ncbi:prolipoprotein diacylglyceryl transferase [Candidatus Dojkabacteria bacterium]|nr:prolipoprotein diacylglyceryl transferase [Candidatus Dojkabacteria bacterium]
MLKSLFTIINFEVSTLLGFSVISIIVFLGILWFLRFRDIEKLDRIRDEDSFDIGLSGVFAGLLTIRIVGFTLSIAHYNIENIFDLVLGFLKFWDGNLYYPMLPFGVILGCWFSVLSKKRIKDTRGILDKVVMAIIPAHILLVTGLFLSSAYYGCVYDGIFSLTYTEDKAGRFPVQLIEIIGLAMVSIIALSRSMREKKGVVSGLYLLIWGLMQSLLRFMTEGYISENGMIDFGHILAILVVLSSFTLFPVKKIDREQKEIQEKRRIFRQRGEDSGKDVRERGGYNVSYGVRGKTGKTF